MNHRANKSIFYRLWMQIDSIHKIQLGGILCLMLIASVFEVISIGAVIPFLTALMEPEVFLNNQLVQSYIDTARIKNNDELVILLTIAFICAALISGITRVSLMWIQTRVSYTIGADLAVKIYERTIYQPYLTHVSRNTSEVISATTSKVDRVISQVIYPITLIFGSVIILAMILVLLVAIEPHIAIATFALFGFIYLFLTFSSKKIIAKSSADISYQQSRVIKILQEGLGGVRDILIDSTQAVYVEDYKKSESSLRKSIANIIIVSGVPRYIVESFGTIFIAALAFWLLQKTGNFLHTISMLGALALAAQRILPLAQQLFAGWSSVKGSIDSLHDVVRLLEQKIPSVDIDSLDLRRDTCKKNPFDDFKALELKNISFKYAESLAWALRNFSLKINRGEKVGIIGITGSGKSTLLDLIMSLLTPVEGHIEVNGISLDAFNVAFWRKKISHVPQQIYLSDATIAQNIAFGVPLLEIDNARVALAAKKAGLANLIESWESGYATVVGERGIRLSGGQRQRIGIARALYKKASIIILDEATSALDSRTENLVMNEISNLGSEVTLVIVAHRLTTLSGCDYIVELEEGKMRQVTSYEKLMKTYFKSEGGGRSKDV